MSFLSLSYFTKDCIFLTCLCLTAKVLDISNIVTLNIDDFVEVVGTERGSFVWTFLSSSVFKCFKVKLRFFKLWILCVIVGVLKLELLLFLLKSLKKKETPEIGSGLASDRDSDKCWLKTSVGLGLGSTLVPPIFNKRNLLARSLSEFLWKSFFQVVDLL